MVYKIINITIIVKKVKFAIFLTPANTGGSLTQKHDNPDPCSAVSHLASPLRVSLGNPLPYTRRHRREDR